MRGRNREINIFNMSLLDILCGALGAFCFMMIVLLPYYKPGTGEDAKAQKELEETIKDLDKLKEKLKDAELAKELAELIEKLKKEIEELKGRVNSLVAENKNLQDQIKGLQKQVDDLAARNKQLEDKANRLDWRQPFIAEAGLGIFLNPEYSGRIDFFLWSDMKAEDGKTMQPRYNPAKFPHSNSWQGELKYSSAGRDPRVVWMVRDVPYDNVWKIYAHLKLEKQDATDPKKFNPIPIFGSVNIEVFVDCYGSDLQYLPPAPVTAEHPWTLVGFIKSDKNDASKVTTRAATQAEREAEWKALGNPPPVPPEKKQEPPPEKKPQ